jgi:uncharacterized phage protein (TIGR02220 family)
MFQQIHDSSVADDYLMRLVFMDLLILADRDGLVNKTPEAIARRTAVPLEIVDEQLRKLMAPDPKSNTPDCDGRRLVPIEEGKPWGWRIVNYKKYRNIKSSDELRAQTRDRVAAFRERKRAVAEENQEPAADPNSPDIPEKTLRFSLARPVLAHLNEKAGKKFRDTDDNLTLVAARLKEVDDDIGGMMKMIDRQVALWRDDPKMRNFLRPETLFGKKKFGAYYDDREEQVIVNGKPVSLKPKGDPNDPNFVRAEKDIPAGGARNAAEERAIMAAVIG